MKVPTYKQETARTRETGSRNFSAQVSGRALAAPFEAQAEVFGQLANQSLDFMSAQLKRERDSQENDEQNAYIEERARVLQVIDETPVGQTFPDPNISKPRDGITFNSESDAERFFEQSMQRFKANRGFQFANKQREDSFTSRIERNDILIKSKLVTNSREKVVAKAFASFSNNLDTLANDALQQARDLPVSFVYDFPSGDEEESFVFALNNPQIQASLKEIFEKIDNGVSSGFFSEEKAIEIKAKTKKDLSLNILKDQINRATSIESLEFMQQQIEKLQTSDISTQDRIALLNATEEDIDAFIAAETAEKKAELARQTGLSADLALKLTEEVLKDPGRAEALRQQLIGGVLDEQLLPSDRITLLRLVNSKVNEVSESQRALIESLTARAGYVEELVGQGRRPDRPAAEKIVSDLIDLGEIERANRLKLVLKVDELTSSVDGMSPGAISAQINDVNDTAPLQMFPGSSAEEAAVFQQIVLNSLKKKGSKASAFFQKGFPLDYFAETNEVPELNYTERESINERLNLVEEATRKFTEGSGQSFDQVKKQMQPLRESEVKGIAKLLDGDRLTPQDKANLLINLQPLLSEYPSTISKLAESKKADVYVLASQLPIPVSADIISGLNQPSVLNEVTRQKLADDVTDKLGQTFLYIRDGKRSQNLIEKAIVAHVRANAPANFEDADLPELIDNAIDLIAPIGKRGDNTFELPRPLNVNGDDDSFGRMFDAAGNEITDLDQKRDLMELWFENFSVDMVKLFAGEGLSDGFDTPEKLEVVVKQIQDGELLPVSINNNKYAFVRGGANMERLSKKNGKPFFVSWTRDIERILYSILLEKQKGIGRGNIASQAEGGETT